MLPFDAPTPKTAPAALLLLLLDESVEFFASKFWNVRQNALSK